MRVVVFGAGGLLGRHVVAEAAEHDVVALDRAACDIGEPDAVMEAAAGADLVVNCAAFTNVDGAEANSAEAHRINASGAANVAAAVERNGAVLIHVSTDFVFDGARAEPCAEDASPAPLSEYGRSKLAGELQVQDACKRLFVVRIQSLYGRGGRNFPSRLRDLLVEGSAFLLDCERRVQPTWVRPVARQLVTLATTEAYGTYHVSCKGAATWAEFARELASRLGVAPNWQEVSTAELGVKAARPRHSLFAHRMLERHGIDRMPDWRRALDDYVAEG